MTLTDFLLARIAEDGAAARSATPGPWRIDSPTYAEAVVAPDGETVVGGGRWGGEASVFDSTHTAMHIALHDPSRVLAECEAKRHMVWRAITLHEQASELEPGDPNYHSFQGQALAWRVALRELALPYDDHPDYDESWRP